MEEFILKIKDLISLGVEGEYWDFKQEWHNNNALLVHDIINMANSPYHGDKYIIIGVTDKHEIVGVDSKKSKELATLIEIFRGLNFSGNHGPKFKIEKIRIDSKIIDVLIILDSLEIPYVLMNGYRNQDKLVRPYFIYIRDGDTNTPIDKSATNELLEKVYRKKFGLDMNVIDKLKIVLSTDGWIKRDGKPSYNSYYPEYSIKIERNEVFEKVNDRFSSFYLDTDLIIDYYKIYCFSTLIFEDELWQLDGSRLIIPAAKIGSFTMDGETIRYYYYLKDSVAGKVLNLFISNENALDSRSGKNGFLIFDNDEERGQFIGYVTSNSGEYTKYQLDYFDEQIIYEEKKRDWAVLMCEDIIRLKYMLKKFKSLR